MHQVIYTFKAAYYPGATATNWFALRAKLHSSYPCILMSVFLLGLLPAMKVEEAHYSEMLSFSQSG
jgi:hypothetical protein